MLRKTRLLVMAISFFIFSSQSFAWTECGEVTEVYSHNGLHIINTTISSSARTKQFYWPTSDPDAQDMFTLALTAFISGKKISVHYSSVNCNAGIGNATLITHLKIK